MNALLHTDLLVKQLAAPGTGPRASDPPDGRVWVSGNRIGTEYVLVVPVRVENASLTVAWVTPPYAIGLTSIDGQGVEQSVSLSEAGKDANHHLVLMWARVRTPTLLGNKPYALEISAGTKPLTLNPQVLDQAIARLWTSNQPLCRRGLIATNRTQPPPTAVRDL